MRVIHAPWRIKYIEQEKNSKCFLCERSRQKNDRKNYILKRGAKAFVILNVFPYNSGHLMIAPYRHVKDIKNLSKDEWDDIILLLRNSVKALKRSMRPEGFNIGVNIGKIAGAGSRHLHIHVVPRWKGDTSFMPVLGDTKILPEHLDATYDRLVGLFK